MLNNDVRLVGVALTNFTIDDKMATLKLEMAKQKSGETYEIEVKAFSNSKSIRFDDKIKGSLVVVAGYLEAKNGNITVIVTNLMAIGKKQNPAIVKDMPVATSQDLENNDLVSDDDLPF